MSVPHSSSHENDFGVDSRNFKNTVGHGIPPPQIEHRHTHQNYFSNWSRTKPNSDLDLNNGKYRPPGLNNGTAEQHAATFLHRNNGNGHKYDTTSQHSTYSDALRFGMGAFKMAEDGGREALNSFYQHHPHLPPMRTPSGDMQQPNHLYHHMDPSLSPHHHLGARQTANAAATHSKLPRPIFSKP